MFEFHARVYCLLQEIVDATQEFVESGEPLAEFLKRDNRPTTSSLQHLSILFDKYDRATGRFLFEDFTPNACVRGSERRYIHRKEAEEVVRETIVELQKRNDWPPAVARESFEDILIGLLFDVLRMPLVMEEMKKLKDELLKVVAPPMAERYPALSSQLQYTDREFRILIEEMTSDLRENAEMSDSAFDKITAFITVLNCLAHARLDRIPDPRQKTLFNTLQGT